MVKGVVEDLVFVKVGHLPARGLPRIDLHDGQKDKIGLFRANLPCRETSGVRANVVVHNRIHTVVRKGIVGK